MYKRQVVIGQYAVTVLSILPKLLCLVFLPDISPAGRGLTVIDQAKMCIRDRSNSLGTAPYITAHLFIPQIVLRTGGGLSLIHI